MKELSEEQFFSQYPRYQNLEELKKADILVMPLHERKSFKGAQRAFYELTQDPSINCRFYVEEKNRIPFYAEFSAPDPALIIQFGLLVVGTINAAKMVYEFLKGKTQGNKFRITHVIRVNNAYYQMDEFEGNIEDYQTIHNQIKTALKK